MARNGFGLFVGLALLAAPAFAAEPAWQTLSPPDSGLTVDVPGDSVLSEDISDPDVIATSRNYTVKVGDDGTAFMVTVVNFKPESRDNMSDDQYYTVGADMIKDCHLRGYAYASGDDPASGRAATYGCSDGRAIRAEFHLKGLRLYRLVAMGPGKTPEGDAAKHFFSSYKAAD
jgi:uncharacterized membrane protein